MLSQMPYAMNMLPMFGMPPLNPFGGMTSPNNQSSIPKMLKAGMMQKVASMPAMHGLVANTGSAPTSGAAGQRVTEDGAVATKQEETNCI